MASDPAYIHESDVGLVAILAEDGDGSAEVLVDCGARGEDEEQALAGYLRRDRDR
jgi:hypothetical protein